jgi:integrase/recombinase XerD
MSDFKQLSMFENMPELGPEQGAAGTAVSPEAPFEEAVRVYLAALKLSGASFHTLRAFRSDLHLLGRWAGPQRPVRQFSTAELNRFLHWMLTERGKPCSPKTYARRVTALKSFFSYLKEEQAVAEDPAAALIQKPVSSPLPEILFDDEVEKALEAARSMRTGDRPDARPLLLIMLLLQTAIKKGECMALRPEDWDRSNQEAPVLWIRYANPRMRYKERKIAIEPDLLGLLDEYISQRKPPGVIFDCTARNLEYVLRDVTLAAGLDRQSLSFEVLRWTAAIRDYTGGMDTEKLRQKLGLSRISWRDTSTKLEQLARQVKEHEARQG